MRTYQYTISFKNGEIYKFNADVDIDFHKIIDANIALNDLYINMSQINYIRKTVIIPEV